MTEWSQVEGVRFCEKANPRKPYPLVTDNAILGLSDLIGTFSHCTGACVGTGLSVEGLDLGLLDSLDVTIGVNEVPKFFDPDFLVITDTRAIVKVMEHLNPDKTKVVCSMRAMHLIAYDDEYRAAFRKLERIYYCHFAQTVADGAFPEETLFYIRGVASAAFALACALGLDTCFLYGFDFYRFHQKVYAYDINIARPEELHSIKGYRTIYTTPAFEGMINSITQNQAAYEGVKFINMSRYSQLKCFPIHENALPPEGTYE